MVLNLMVLFLQSKAENYKALQSHDQQNISKKYQSFLAKRLKDQYIVMNIKQKMRIQIWQMSIEYAE